MQIGAQLYTIRDHLRTLEDYSLSLRKIADIGYKIVQISGGCACDAQWLKKELDANGLQCVLTHFPEKRLREETAAVIADHNALDCKCVGLGQYKFRPEEGESVDQFVELYHPMAKELKAAGKYFMYHNHAHEFRKENGRLVFDQLMERIPADEMGFTVDTYWVQRGGGDPAQWLEKLAGRIPCIHLKDYAHDQVMAVVGEGNINFDRVFEKAEAGGTKYMLVEQDSCYGEDPFDCLKRSYEYLKAQGFE